MQKPEPRSAKTPGEACTYPPKAHCQLMLDLNTATIEELQTLPSIDLRAAYDLLLWRPYLTWDEVAYVPGFDRARARTLKAAGASVGLPREPRRPVETPLRRL